MIHHRALPSFPPRDAFKKDIGNGRTNATPHGTGEHATKWPGSSVDRGESWPYSYFISAEAERPAEPANTEAEIDRVFSETRPLIQMALVHYRVGNRDGLAIERDLRLWFRRLVQRVNNALTPVSAFRKYLLLATCEFAYSYQVRNLEAQASDARLKEVLSRSPRAVAAALQKML